jgi:hypothetical protein
MGDPPGNPILQGRGVLSGQRTTARAPCLGGRLPSDLGVCGADGRNRLLNRGDAPMTPLERVEALYHQLVADYGEGKDREVRAASKLLMVALLQLQEHGGPGWQGMVEDYVLMLKNDPERYRSMLDANRGVNKGRSRHDV